MNQRKLEILMLILKTIAYWNKIIDIDIDNYNTMATTSLKKQSSISFEESSCEIHMDSERVSVH